MYVLGISAYYYDNAACLPRLSGQRPLAVGFDKSKASYGIARERKEYDPSRSEKRF